MRQSESILIIEDNEMSLKMAQKLLRIAGYDTLEAMDAESGIHLAREHQPDLILMDMHLPIKSGYEASRELKGAPETKNIPIVAFTALAMEEEQKKALAHGCMGVISKPIDIRSFAQTVEFFLQSPRPLSPENELPIENQTDPQQDNPEPSGACAHCAGLVEQAHQDLEDFLYAASHDLQSPLRRAKRFATFLEQSLIHGDHSEDRAQVYLHGILRNIRDMETLLSALLNLSRANRQTAPHTKVSLTDVVQGAIKRYQNEINLLDAQVEVDELPLVFVDTRQMQQVFEELLGNALKFRKNNEVPVVHVKNSSISGDCCQVTIQDNGIGFEERHSELIFKPFQRLNASTRYGGHGIGLAIAKKIIERHGGTISANGLPNQGAAFSLCLPLEMA